MQWNWQQPDWPDFSFDPKRLEAGEARFLQQSGFLSGLFRHLITAEKDDLIVDIMSEEAVKTSEIEGEYFDRESVRSSIRRNLGLVAPERPSTPAVRGIADMVTDLSRSFAEPLTHDMLFHWHRLLMQGHAMVKDSGQYRTDSAPMQVVSGPDYKRKVHFEAPPSHRVPSEMNCFIDWFNRTAPQEKNALPALTRASIAHLYFVSIHPFDDGNGRIARALAEKILAQNLGQPNMIILSGTIQAYKTKYYAALENNNKHNAIDAWMLYFTDTILEAQAMTQNWVEFVLEKTKLYDRLRGHLNTRQEKVLEKLFRAGPKGFIGGLNAEKYIAITGTSRATATRDLQDLLEKQVLVKQGSLKATRYYLNVNAALHKKTLTL